MTLNRGINKLMADSDGAKLSIRVSSGSIGKITRGDGLSAQILCCHTTCLRMIDINYHIRSLSNVLIKIRSVRGPEG